MRLRDHVTTAVLVWPDIFGLRPAFRQMGRRLAESGYAVLTPNPFYRTKHAPTTTPGAPGLFTDAGGPFLATDEVGLAGRLRINAAADPDQGGSLYRLRDGLGATVEGPLGDATLLKALHGALLDARPLSSTALPAGSRSLATLTAEILSDASARRLSGQSDQAFASARLTALTDLEAQNGIDTHREM